jgi:hypothetical protein
MFVQHSIEIVTVVNFFTADANNDIAQVHVAVVSLSQAMQAGICCSTTGRNLPDQHAS